MEAKAAPVTSEDPLYDQAVEALKDNPEGDAKSLQRQFRIGSDRAEKLFNEIKTHNETANALNPWGQEIGSPEAIARLGAHELSHALIADRLGINIEGIVKTPTGAGIKLNYSAMERKPIDPADIHNLLTYLAGKTGVESLETPGRAESILRMTQSREAILSTLTAGGLSDRALGSAPEEG